MKLPGHKLRHPAPSTGHRTVDAMIKAVRGGDKFAEHVVRRYIAWAIDRGRFGELLVWFQAIALEIISIGRISRA